MVLKSMNKILESLCYGTFVGLVATGRWMKNVVTLETQLVFILHVTKKRK